MDTPLQSGVTLYDRFMPHLHRNKRGTVNNGAFSHDVMAAILVFQNKGMAAMMVYQTNPPGIDLYFYANTFFCFSNPIRLLVT